MLLLLLAVQVAAPSASAAPAPAPQKLVEIRDLQPREYRAAGFVLSTAQDVRVDAIGAEPRADKLDSDGDSWSWRDDERSTWPAAAWILDARTREVVWDLRAADTERQPSGLREFSGTVRLPAGVYEAHYASFAAARLSKISGLGLLRAQLGGPYVEDQSYKRFAITVIAVGRAARPEELDAARRVFRAAAIATLQPAPDKTERFAFELGRPTAVEVFAIGELTKENAADYGWIINADTHARVWTMDLAHSEPAGGSQKNRLVRETLRLPAGRYVAYFTCDATHDPREWTAVPAYDPELWGLTLLVPDSTARRTVRPFDYEPVPAGQTIVSLTGIGDGETRSSGFTVKRPLEVRIYAIGESVNDRMVDYAWIVNARAHRRIWTMQLAETQEAGGSAKNRVFDGTLRLAPGDYVVYYTSDGSHSAQDWNAAPPAEARWWGVSVFPTTGRLDPATVGPYDRAAARNVLAALVRMENDEQAERAFTLDRPADVRVYAVGEGVSADMVDYGWIEESATGRVVWKMTYDATTPAGGAEKNRAFDGVVHLAAGAYVLHYRSDGSHAYGNWNDRLPDDPDAWGVTVFRTRDR